MYGHTSHILTIIKATIIKTWNKKPVHVLDAFKSTPTRVYNLNLNYMETIYIRLVVCWIIKYHNIHKSISYLTYSTYLISNITGYVNHKQWLCISTITNKQQNNLYHLYNFHAKTLDNFLSLDPYLLSNNIHVHIIS